MLWAPVTNDPDAGQACTTSREIDRSLRRADLERSPEKPLRTRLSETAHFDLSRGGTCGAHDASLGRRIPRAS
jgi:hypothetical protein